MNEEQFNKFLEGELSRIREVMTIKSTYRTPENVFHNFDTGATIENKSREEIIWGMAIKHFISIQDIRSGLKEGKLPSKETLDEKYTDLINYLLLEKASIEDKIEKQKRREALVKITGCDDDPCETKKSLADYMKDEGKNYWHVGSEISKTSPKFAKEWCAYYLKKNQPRRDNALDKIMIINQTKTK